MGEVGGETIGDVVTFPPAPPVLPGVAVTPGLAPVLGETDG